MSKISSKLFNILVGIILLTNLMPLRVFAQTACPCTVFTNQLPTLSNENNGSALELGMKFRASSAGYITGMRFYKGNTSTAGYTANLWSLSGTNLATLNFTGQSATGWQQISFGAPVAVTANTTYVVSYHAQNGQYAATPSGLSSVIVNGPLQALANGTDGPNGIFAVSPTSTFPTSTFNSNNYFVDPVFDYTNGDSTPPTVTAVSPSNNATNVSKSIDAVAYFSKAMTPSTINSSTVELRDAANVLVPAAITYDATAKSAVISPNSMLVSTTTYTAKIKGGTSGVKDAAPTPNSLASDYTWSFTTGGPGPEEGPGGPILVVGANSNSFSRYYAEILRSEGLNEFSAANVNELSASLLSSYDVLVLGEVALSDAQVTLLSDWVNAGGNLITNRPDKKLAGLLGLTDNSSSRPNQYIKINTSVSPGKGIVSETIQYHGAADNYTLNGAQEVAKLYSDESTPTSNPAVTLRDVGTNGGQAAAFTYDLAKSVVYTRQGNPLWIGDERDGNSVVRASDMFYGAKAGDIQPDWINLNKVAIPQADEQQRLLANMILEMNKDKKPLPRFWYLPSNRKAVIVHALDDHGTPNGTTATFDKFNTASPSGCSVADWQCYRATSWFYTSIPLTNAQAVNYQTQGHELGIHVNNGCRNYTTPQELASVFTSELSSFAAKYPGVTAQITNRTHCIPWSDWDSMPKTEVANGIRLDMGYYYWPGSWVQNRPGYFTGSAFPQRYTEVNGKFIDVYQAATNVVNENGLAYPAATNAMLDKALGSEGYYAVLSTHDDYSDNGPFSDSIISSAQSRGVAIVTAKQMLNWLDGRNASSFQSISWNKATSELSFNINQAAGAKNLSGMLPVNSGARSLRTITKDGSPVTFKTETIKGVDYALYPAESGAYKATYADSTPPPAPTSYTLFNPTDVPANPSDPDTSAVELGMKFSSNVNGQVTGVRFYKSSANTGAHIGNLWDSNGTKLASVNFSGETASGWQQASFSAPVNITANNNYVISYHAPVGRYAGDNNYFTASKTSGPLTAPASSAASGNGVYKYGASGFPSNTYNASNYWVDVVFSTNTNPPPPDTQPPTAPTNLSAASVSSSQVSLTWNASTDNVAVTKYRIFRDGSQRAETTASSYTDNVSPSTAYSYYVVALDAAGNVSQPSNTLNLTTPSAASCPCNIFGSTAPSLPSSNDTGAVELGMKFRASSNGFVSGVRFYKHTGNTGTHVGRLWNASTGTLMGSVTFSGETPSGWQQANFSSPIAITQNTTYIISYHAPNGRYAFESNRFSSAGIDSGPLRALSTSESPNGVYRYGQGGVLPVSSYNSSNYWVDVVFNP